MHSTQEASELQASYYAATAAQYDTVHGEELGPAHDYAVSLLKLRNCKTVLDVGAGTGNAIKLFHHSGFDVRGIEPVAELIEVAFTKGVAPETIIQGEGQQLPFEDNSFDAVCEFGMLHHVQEPERVVKEMVRVARYMVIIVDSNRFGQGPRATRLLKLLIYKMGLWKAADWIRTKGKGYMVSEGDGVFYSYSVYDSLHILRNWADELMLMGTGAQNNPGEWLHPLLTSAGVLACALKK